MDGDEPSAAAPPASGPDTASTPEATTAAALEPGFVSFAYFLRFLFEPGRYAPGGA
ncbi:MAG: hypothetical protein R2712_02885 [Vicinamibacterales bacterium]